MPGQLGRIFLFKLGDHIVHQGLKVVVLQGFQVLLVVNGKNHFARFAYADHHRVGWLVLGKAHAHDRKKEYQKHRPSLIHTISFMIVLFVLFKIEGKEFVFRLTQVAQPAVTIFCIAGKIDHFQ